MKDGDFVIPGDKLGEVDKYKAGSWTYEEGGFIKSIAVGYVKIDKRKKEISVIPLNDPTPLRVDDIVIGEVFSVSNTIANIKAYFKYVKGDLVQLIRPFSTTLHNSRIGFRIKKMSDYMKTGDIIIGKIVLDNDIPYPLSIRGREFGVVAAYCGSCGGKMRRVNGEGNEVTCTKCGKVERRKLSSLYDFDTFSKHFKAFKPKEHEIVHG